MCLKIPLPHPHRGRVQAKKKSSNTVIVREMTIATLKAVNYQQVFQIVPLPAVAARAFGPGRVCG